MRYRNAPAAIEWLCQAFGFEKHLAVSGENRTIAHAQLTWGNGMMMLGSVRDNEIPVNERVATAFGLKKADQERLGRRVPNWDLLIAATARVRGLVLRRSR
jgi:uncharacterized glyoxalase superfamily protein PhnB